MIVTWKCKEENGPSFSLYLEILPKNFFTSYKVAVAYYLVDIAIVKVEEVFNCRNRKATRTLTFHNCTQCTT